MIAAASPSFTSVSAKVASSAAIAMSDGGDDADAAGADGAVHPDHDRLAHRDDRAAGARRSGGRPPPCPSAVASERSAPEQNTLPAARDEHHPHLGVGLGRLERGEQLGDQLPAQRVAVVLAVEGDRGARALDVVGGRARRSCGHPRKPPAAVLGSQPAEHALQLGEAAGAQLREQLGLDVEDGVEGGLQRRRSPGP